MRRGVLHAEHHAAHQGRHRGVEAGNLEAFDAAGLRRAAGVVEQTIKAAEFLDRLPDQRAHLVFNRDIGLAEDAVGAEFAGQRLAFRRATSGNDDLRAFRDENLRGPQPDAACRASDHRNLAVQPSHVILLVFEQYCVSSYSHPAGTTQAHAGCVPRCRAGFVAFVAARRVFSPILGAFKIR